MTKHPRSIGRLALPVAILLAGCAPVADDASTTRPDVEREIEEFLDAYVETLAARDTAIIRPFYSQDADFLWMEDGEIRYRSPDEILASLAALPEGTRVETRLIDPDIAVLGPDLALARTAFHSTFGDPAAGGFQFGGALSILIERSAGSWRILSGHTSSARPD